jgi:peptidoglycan/xylan/chitin deacetylase (PgdA/CDA1 family)
MPAPRSTMIKFSSRVSNSLRDISWAFGLNSSLEKARGCRILVYHGICADDHLRYNTLFLKLKTFEQQLKLFKKYFQVISLDDYYHLRFSDQRFAVCLTFDDGFANNYKYVLPLLEQYKVPATFFITGIRDAGYDILWNDVLAMAYCHGPSEIVFQSQVYVKRKEGKYRSVSTGKYLADKLRNLEFDAKAEMIQILESFRRKADDDYWMQMTKDEIKGLSCSKWVTIGSHGYYHNDLAKVSIASLKNELYRSKQFLENITGKEVKALAFPYGSYSKEVLKQAVYSGYSQLLATDFLLPGDTGDAILKDRLTVNPFISGYNQLYAGVIGKYD